MEICSGKYHSSHEEVVFDGKYCPACAAMEEIDTLLKKIDELESRLEDQKKGE